MKRSVNLDVLRIIAAFMVFTLHAFLQGGVAFSVGQAGVQLFFILSGFLGFASLDREKGAKEYYIGRAKKILPTYWTCLLFLYLSDLLWAFRTYGLSYRMFQGQCSYKFLRYVFMVNCILPSDNWDMWSNHSALWTMSAFFLFWILAPWLYKLMRRFWGAIIILTLSVVAQNLLIKYLLSLVDNYPNEAKFIHQATMNAFVELPYFLLGAVLVIALRENKETFYLFLVGFITVFSNLTQSPFPIIFILILFVAVKGADIVTNEKVVKIIRGIADISFTLYLIHPPLFIYFEKAQKHLGLDIKWLHVAVIYVSSISFAYLLYNGIIKKIEKKLNVSR
jgi:peptidoglycan/LPS O-acetylase OafA/YrhL